MKIPGRRKNAARLDEEQHKKDLDTAFCKPKLVFVTPEKNRMSRLAFGRLKKPVKLRLYERADF